MSTQQALDDHAALVALLWDAYMTAQCEPGPMDWAARAVLASEWLAKRDAAATTDLRAQIEADALKLVREWTRMDGRLALSGRDLADFRDQLADVISGRAS